MTAITKPQTARTEGSPPNLHQRIVALRAEVKGIPKRGAAPKEMGGFMYVLDADVAAEARELFVRHGIAYVPSMVGHSTEAVGKTNGGKTIWRSTVDVELELSNMDDPAQVVRVRWASHSDDTGDKGLSQAGTSAIKYATVKFLQVGEAQADPDAATHPSASHAPDDAAPRPAGELGGNGHRAPACPTCAEKGIEGASMWPARGGPRKGELQCNGKDADGRYQNHYLPDDAAALDDGRQVYAAEMLTRLPAQRAMLVKAAGYRTGAGYSDVRGFLATLSPAQLDTLIAAVEGQLKALEATDIDPESVPF